jgi:diguanylate cyclase (GGDEF)-like protein
MTGLLQRIMKKNLLIVEDNRISGTLIRAKVASTLDFSIHWAQSLGEAVELLDRYDNDFFAALLDYVLPDAPGGEIVDEVVSRGISSIVFTATVTEKVRKELWKKNIVDYVIKDDAQSIEYLTFLLSRLEKNQHIKVLVADDSRFFRVVLSRLLRVQNYQVLEAVDGEDALRIVEANPDIRLVITDYMMPNMDGFTLTRRLRKKYGREGVVILGVTSDRDKTMGAQFIKCGANDFIEKKSFIAEELYCRINQNLENLESIQTIRKMATTDFLTGLYNRRHFCELATKLCSSASRNKHDIACAMIDADHFKTINDSYGHAIGDRVLKHLAQILGSYFQRSSDLIGRMGGEEFCVLADNVKPQDAPVLFEELCRQVESTPFALPEGGELGLSVSMGVCTIVGDGLDSMLKRADELLYRAKNGGRNRAVIDVETTNSEQ